MMETTFSLFQYQVLETSTTIRLLSINPSPLEAPVTCNLIHVDLANSP